ncbi:hypothetical protein NXW13_00725 [Bacteroides thetaiotaomicron]|nr:hypothetical protein [Bacteroides thetaiotaomicron]
MPLTEGSYTLASAIAARYRRNTRPGRVITFEDITSATGDVAIYRNRPGCWDQEASREEFGSKGTVKSVTVNGEKQTPDATGVNVSVDILEVDETLSLDSTNPVRKLKVVTARLNEVDASTLFNVVRR